MSQFRKDHSAPAISTDHSILSLIKNQNNEEAKLLIKNESLHNATDTSNNTLLHYAAEYGNPEIVQFLIKLGSNIDARNNPEQTPLIKSLESDEPCQQVIEILLESRAHIDWRALIIVNSIEWLRKSTTRFEILKIFLERAIDLNDFYGVLESGNQDIIKLLLQTNINLHKAYDGERTLVHVLAMNSNPGVIELMNGRNFDVNARDIHGTTPLMYATDEGNASAVEFLLNHGADIEARDNYYNRTALFRASVVQCVGYNFRKEKQNKTIQVLLEHGANIEIQIANNVFITIFDILSSHENFELAELVLAHLALHEARKLPITDLIRSKIDEKSHFKSHFERCQQLLLIEIYSKMTLLDMLTTNERKLERFFRNKESASELIDIQTTNDYFDTVLGKRFIQVMKMVELRRTAAPIVSKLMMMDYDSYPFIFDQIVDYLKKQDIENLILIENETSCAIVDVN